MGQKRRKYPHAITRPTDIGQIHCPVCGSRNATSLQPFGEFSIQRCAACDVEFANPMRAPGKEWYEQHALYKNRHQFVGEYLGWMHHEFLAALQGDGKRLLDVGCGTGDFVAAAMKRGYDAIGLDFDSHAIALGRKHWNMSNLYDLSIEEYFARTRERFDCVTFYEVLEHLEEPGTFLRGLKKYLRKGGRISFSIPNRDSRLNSLYRKLVPGIDYPPHHLTRWSKQAVWNALAMFGYDIEVFKILPPSFSDQTFDILRTRFEWLPRTPQKLVSLGTSVLLRPLDILLQKASSQEGRGMMVIARAR